MWQTINEVINNRQKSTPNQYFKINNCSTSNATAIVNEFNNYFVNIGPTLAKIVPTTNKVIQDYSPVKTSILCIFLLQTKMKLQKL